MRTTLTLTVEEEMARFIASQQGLVDPSALINKLIHEDMERKGIQISSDSKSKLQDDEILQALELHIDENTHAAD
jgi:hypothetical protein